MTTRNETAAVAATTTTEQNNEQAVQTSDDTPKRRTWHIDAGRTDDGRVRGLCGWESKPVFWVSDAPLVPVDHCTPVECPDCRALASMQNPAVQRRKRAEAIAEFVLRYLDEKEAE